MSRTNHFAQILVLRRLQTAQGVFEPMEIDLSESGVAVSTDAPETGCKITIIEATEGLPLLENFHKYQVLLSGNVCVRPVDWRRFAFNEAKVSELVSTCVHDNLVDVAFSPHTDELVRRVETRLTLALRDVSTIFDTGSVHCSFRNAAELKVEIEGEFKNAKRINLNFMVS